MFVISTIRRLYVRHRRKRAVAHMTHTIESPMVGVDVDIYRDMYILTAFVTARSQLAHTLRSCPEHNNLALSFLLA